MKVSELDNIIESVISEEIRKTILEQAVKENYEVYHIKCEGEPVETCHSEDEAQEIVNKLEKEQEEIREITARIIKEIIQKN